MLKAPERMDRSGLGRPLPPLEAEVHTDGQGLPELRLRGEIDIVTVPVFREALSALVEGGGDVVVDLAGVDFIGLAGLEALCSEARCLRQRGGRLVVSSPSTLTRRVIAIMGVAELLSLAEEPAPG